MFTHTSKSLLLGCLLTATLWAATDPFVGDWKFNPSRSKMTDVMKVASLGGNKYEFDFGGGPESIVANGTDQPGVYGTMLSVTIEAPNSWRVVRKKDGRTLLTAIWKLSKNSNILSDDYTGFGSTGPESTVNYLYKRTTAGVGFAGTWESNAPMLSSFVLQIRPYEDNGLSLIRLPQKVSRNLKFDGKDYPNQGGAKGSTSSARHVNQHTLEITEKMNGKITRTDQIVLSPDLKTLTRTVRPVGQQEPNIFVFERQ